MSEEIKYKTFSREEVQNIVKNVVWDIYEMIDENSRSNVEYAKEDALKALIAPKDEQQDYKSRALKYNGISYELNHINNMISKRKGMYAIVENFLHQDFKDEREKANELNEQS